MELTSAVTPEQSFVLFVELREMPKCHSFQNLVRLGIRDSELEICQLSCGFPQHLAGAEVSPMKLQPGRAELDGSVFCEQPVKKPWKASPQPKFRSNSGFTGAPIH